MGAMRAVGATDAVRGLDIARADAVAARDRAIRADLADGVTVADVVRATGLSRSLVERVRDGRPRSGAHGRRVRPEMRSVRLSAQSDGFASLEASQGVEDGDYVREPVDPGA